jgi:hypothetical protein
VAVLRDQAEPLGQLDPQRAERDRRDVAAVGDEQQQVAVGGLELGVDRADRP